MSYSNITYQAERATHTCTLLVAESMHTVLVVAGAATVAVAVAVGPSLRKGTGSVCEYNNTLRLKQQI